MLTAWELARLQQLNHCQCILFTVIEILPPGASLIHCIRAYTRYRMLVGLGCVSTSQHVALSEAAAEYQRQCSVSRLLTDTIALRTSQH